ncbi:MAG: phosphatidylglycerophosphatase A [Candidatus Marinimicrobia bacterium]|nr:phosphatidylglycerophosphatase A [Candidatus Neomarinimicrobiota bacterium]MCH7859342.1 phosphatidylglycerophosphatase A [Candidatus Neomarinimicrobiota bacterium]
MAYIVGTVGFAGYLRPAPGSWGSLIGALVWWFMVPDQLVFQLLMVGLVMMAGVWSAGVIERHSGHHDPALVVIDEVAGMWIALLGAQHVGWYFLAAFVIFRVLDITKPGPVNRLQDLPGGWGVMMDDVAAGAATLAVVWVLGRLI